MQLYLSSYKLGAHTDKLIHMAGGHGAGMAVITNALDAIPIEARFEYARNVFDPLIYFRENGFEPALIDLRNYFGRENDLERVLSRYRIIWAIGGNCFLLRRAMRDSGFDNAIRLLLGRGHIYAGWSAGACVAGSSLRAVAIMDEPEARAPGYISTDPIWDGLGLVPFTVIPHWDSDHPEARLAAKALAWAQAENIDHVALRDGDVVIQHNEEPEICRET